MASYDGTVKIGAEVDSDKAKKDLDALGKDAEGSASKITDGFKLAAGAIAAIGTAMAAVKVGDFIKDVVNTGKQFDTSMSQVQATMGVTIEAVETFGSKSVDAMSESEKAAGLASGALSNLNGEVVPTMDALSDLAIEMGSSTAFSASQCADALNYLALAGYDTQQMADTLPTVLNLAASGGLELATASDMVTDAMSALGLTVEDASTMVDQMAKTASKSNTSVGQLGDAILTVGGTAKTMAGGMYTLADGTTVATSKTTEMNTALGILANNGIKGSEGGTHLRNVLLSLQAPTTEADKALRNLGVAVYDANGEMRPMNDILVDLNASMSGMSTKDKQNLITQIFNKTDLSAVNALLANVGGTIQGVDECITNSGINLEKYNSTWQGTGDFVTGLASQLSYSISQGALESEESMNELIDFIANEYDMTFEDATAVVESLSDAVVEDGSAWQDLALQIEDSAGAAQDMADTQLNNLEGQLTILDSAMEGFKLSLWENMRDPLMNLAKVGTDAVTQLTQAFNDDGLVGLITCGARIITNLLTGISQEMPNVMIQATEIIRTVIDTVTRQAPEVISAAADTIASFISGLGNALPTLIPKGLEMVITIVNSIADNIPKIVQAGVDLLKGLVQGIVNSLPTLIEKGPEAINKFSDAIYKGLGTILTTGVKLIGELAKGIIQNMPLIVKNAGQIFTAILNVFTLSKLASLGKSLMTNLGSGIKSMLSSVGSTAKSVGQNALNMIKNINWNNLGQSIIKMIVSGLKAIASNLGTALKSAGSTAMNAIKNISWSSVGTAIINGIKSGIVGAAKGLASAAVDAAKGALNSVKSALGIHSPSRVFRDEVGKMEIAGIEVAWDEGKEEMADKAMRAMQEMKKRLGSVDMSAIFEQIKLPDLNVVDWYNRLTDGKITLSQPQTDNQNLKATINTDEIREATKKAITEGMSRIKVVLDGEDVGQMLAPYIDKFAPKPEF